MASPLFDDPRPAATVLVVYAQSAFRSALAKLRNDGWDVHPVLMPEGQQVDPSLIPNECRVVVVECSETLLPTLHELRRLADAAALPLVGVVTTSPIPAFSVTCDALTWAGDASFAAQLAQHERWHSRLHNTSHREPVAKLQAQRRLNYFKPYAEFFRNSADAMVVVSYTGEVLYANPAAKTFAGRYLTARGTNVLDYLQATDRRRAVGLTHAMQSGQSPVSSDFTVTTDSGPHIVSVSASIILKSSKAILISFRDVTSQREVERALTHTKDFLERVIDSSVDAIVSADLKGNILVFNRAASRIFGYPPGTVIGRLNVRALYPPGDAQAVMRRIRSPDDGGTGRLEGYETFMVDKQGQSVPVRLSAAIVREDGRPVATVGVFTDIRQELAMRKRILEAETELREKEKGVALAELAGMTAHELNQPLTCVLSYSELLQRKCTQPDVTMAAGVIINQAQRMAEIVKRIGRITRYETKGYVGGASILDLDKAAHKK